jgi:transaldolase
MLDRISTRIFADGADLDGILALAADPRIKGFTTNPTLMHKATLRSYAESPTACSSASPSIPSPARCLPTIRTGSPARRAG